MNFGVPLEIQCNEASGEKGEVGELFMNGKILFTGMRRHECGGRKRMAQLPLGPWKRRQSTVRSIYRPS